MPLTLTDFELRPYVYLYFVQGWQHRLYTDMFQNSNGASPGDLSLINLVNCSWDGTYLTPTLGQTNFSFRLQGSTVDISGFAYPVLYDNIKVSSLKSILGISNNNYSSILTSPNLNTRSRYVSDKTAPHGAGEMRKYFHGTGWKLDRTNVEVGSTSKIWLQRQQNTFENYPYKVEFQIGSSVQSTKTGDMSGSYYKIISSDPLSFTTNGYNTTASFNINVYTNEESGWVKDTANSYTTTVTLYGPPFMDGAYSTGSKLTRSINFTIAVLNQSGGALTRYIRATVNRNGTVYQSQNSDGAVSIGTGQQSFSHTITWDNTVGLNLSSTVINVWFSTQADGGGDTYYLANGIA